MKNQWIVENALKTTVLKSKTGNFVCTKCFVEKDLKYKATRDGCCKTCRNKWSAETFRLNKIPRKCIKCKTTSLNFSGRNNICRPCLLKAHKTRQRIFKNGLGEKLLILWKAGYPYDQALDTIRKSLWKKNIKKEEI